MAAEISWENNGEANADGEFIAVIRQPNRRPDRFIGKSYREVADKLLLSQAQAAEKIRSQADTIRKTKPAETAPKGPVPVAPMNASERMQRATDMTDPAKFDDAIKRVMETQLGMTVEEAKGRLQRDQEREESDRINADCKTFLANNPDFYNCKANIHQLVSWMQLRKIAISVEGFEQAFDALKDEEILVERPAEKPVERVEEKPERSSTGMRRGESSGMPGQRAAKEKWTAEQINAMSDDEIRNRKGDPEFRAAVDKAFAKRERAS